MLPRLPSVLRFAGRLGLAASLMVALLLLVVALTAWPHRNDLEDFANLMMATHASHPELSLVTDDWNLVRTSFGQQMPFDPLRPETPAEWRLLGARLTTLGDRNVLYTRWSDGERTYSLSVYCASQFDIPRQLERRTLIPPLAGTEPHCRVILWADRHCDYVLVIDDPAVPSASPASQFQLEGSLTCHMLPHLRW